LAYSSTRRITPLLRMSLPSSVTATAPTSFSSAISVISLPCMPLVAQAAGRILMTGRLPRARLTNSTMPALSMRGLGVGHGHHGGEAAPGGGAAAGLDGLLRLKAGLAEVHVDVHQAGAHDAAGGVDGGVALKVFADLRDCCAIEEDIQVFGDAAGGIDDVAVFDYCGHGITSIKGCNGKHRCNSKSKFMVNGVGKIFTTKSTKHTKKKMKREREVRKNPTTNEHESTRIRNQDSTHEGGFSRARELAAIKQRRILTSKNSKGAKVDLLSFYLSPLRLNLILNYSIHVEF
jgi:hypothetical protein